MGDKSKIEWTDATWNPIRARAGDKVGWHCTHVSEGCRLCYAERMNEWRGTGFAYKPGHEKDITMFVAAHMLAQPIRWRKARNIFPCSMTDLFGDFVQPHWRDRMFAVMGIASWHQFQVVTKRDMAMQAYMKAFSWERVRESCRGEPIDAIILDMLDTLKDRHLPARNVWMGVSVENEDAELRVENLIDTPATYRWLSIEPLIGPVKLSRRALRHLDWVVVGGESGPEDQVRFIDGFEAAARDLRDQCRSYDVPFFMKQMPLKRPIPDDLLVRQYPRLSA